MSTATLLRMNLERVSEIARTLQRIPVTTVQRLTKGGVLTVLELRELTDERMHALGLDETDIAGVRRALAETT